MLTYKVVLWDIVGGGPEFLDQYADDQAVEIVDTVAIDDSQEGVLLSQLMSCSDQWDYLFINGYLIEEAISVLKSFRIPMDRTLFLLSPTDMYRQRKIAYPVFGEHIDLYVGWGLAHDMGRFMTACIDDLVFTGASSDLAIMKYMYTGRQVCSKEEMDIFFELAQKYFTFSDKQFYFCDIGANIGTTSIYFKKKKDPDISILAIEAVKQNYDLLRANLILNDVDQGNTILHLGVSDVNGELNIAINTDNAGANSFLGKSDVTEKVRVSPFDDIIQENGIDPETLKYLWVDLEGYEYQFIQGAYKTLQSINAPIQMEYTSNLMRANGTEKACVDLLNSLYRRFIVIQEEDHAEHPIEELYDWMNQDVEQVDLFFLK